MLCSLCRLPSANSQLKPRPCSSLFAILGSWLLHGSCSSSACPLLFLLLPPHGFAAAPPCSPSSSVGFLSILVQNFLTSLLPPRRRSFFAVPSCPRRRQLPAGLSLQFVGQLFRSSSTSSNSSSAIAFHDRLSSRPASCRRLPASLLQPLISAATLSSSPSLAGQLTCYASSIAVHVVGHLLSLQASSLHLFTTSKLTVHLCLITVNILSRLSLFCLVQATVAAVPATSSSSSRAIVTQFSVPCTLVQQPLSTPCAALSLVSSTRSSLAAAWLGLAWLVTFHSIFF